MAGFRRAGHIFTFWTLHSLIPLDMKLHLRRIITLGLLKHFYEQLNYLQLALFAIITVGFIC